MAAAERVEKFSQDVSAAGLKRESEAAEEEEVGEKKKPRFI